MSTYRTSGIDDAAALGRGGFGLDAAARASLVNRTHRVVRQRATAMKEQKSYVRSLMLPLALCSVLLVLAGFAIWSGIYQNDAAEAIQDSLANVDVNNHLLVVMLWFVPLTLILLMAVWVRHVRSRESETGR